MVAGLLQNFTPSSVLVVCVLLVILNTEMPALRNSIAFATALPSTSKAKSFGKLGKRGIAASTKRGLCVQKKRATHGLYGAPPTTQCSRNPVLIKEANHDCGPEIQAPRLTRVGSSARTRWVRSVHIFRRIPPSAALISPSPLISSCRSRQTLNIHLQSPSGGENAPANSILVAS